MNNFSKNILIWVAIFLTALVIFNNFKAPLDQSSEISYSEFLNLVDAGEVLSVDITGRQLSADHKNGSQVKAMSPAYDPDLIKELRAKNVNIKVNEVESNTFLMALMQWAPWLLFIGIWIYFMRQMQGGGKGGAFSFGKSRAQMMDQDQVKVTFSDVAGADEAKQELEEVVDFLKAPRKFQKLGGKIPKGVLLMGPPGTGKTLLAKSVAGEAGVPFFTISGSDFVEMFVGVGAARVRDLFEQGKKNAPCIIFIDEIDAVGRHRGAGLGGGNDEREQTLNQMLVEMDGFESNEGVILIAATNRPDVLDPALMRPGRFDRQVMVPLPDIKGREGILNVHVKKVPLSADVKTEVIARGTPGFSGADLANLVNEAALMAARHNKRMVDMEDFEMAKDKVIMGPERRSTVMTEDQKKTTAYHEGGHAIVNLFLEGDKDPLHKVTIIPRGRALGVTMSLPVEDKFTQDKVYLENQISLLMGGRIAEELVMNQMTTGASNDIERATDIARKMVTSWGMSKLGPINFGQNESQVFLGRDISQRHDVAEVTASAIDAEIKTIIERNYKRAEKIIKKHLDDLHKMAEALLEHETLERDQIDDLLAGKKIVAKQTSRRVKKAKEEAEAKHKARTKKAAPKTAGKATKAAPKKKTSTKKTTKK